MDPKRVRALVRKLSEKDLHRLRECLDHALTKPHRETTALVPRLVRGHHHVPHDMADRILAAIKGLRAEELLWVLDHADDAAPE